MMRWLCLMDRMSVIRPDQNRSECVTCATNIGQQHSLISLSQHQPIYSSLSAWSLLGACKGPGIKAKETRILLILWWIVGEVSERWEDCVEDWLWLLWLLLSEDWLEWIQDCYSHTAITHDTINTRTQWTTP